MILATTFKNLRPLLARIRKDKKKILFVPTMGGLHAGHQALIQCAQREHGFVLVSTFINRHQFSQHTDFQHYPRSNKQDQEQCKALGVDCVFVPSDQEMATDQKPELICTMQTLTANLCGRTRKNHFSGVMSVLLKFFYHIHPDVVFMGLKDFQQYRIVCQMVRDLVWNIDVRGVPSVRDKNGLVYSSRNRCLSDSSLRAAQLIYRNLLLAKKNIQTRQTDLASICQTAATNIESNSQNRVEYLEIVDAQDLQLLAAFQTSVKSEQEKSSCNPTKKNYLKEKINLQSSFKHMIIAVAVWVGSIRLIDNVEVKMNSR